LKKWPVEQFTHMAYDESTAWFRVQHCLNLCGLLQKLQVYIWLF